MYIKPVLAYTNEVLDSTADSTVYKLERIQNQAMSLITGVVGSTSIAIMQLLTKIHTVKFKLLKNSEFFF